MGPYCKFCNARCFIHDPRTRGAYLLATCTRGKAFDLERLGYNAEDVGEPRRYQQPTITPVVLLPCPFCGAPPDQRIYYDAHNDLRVVSCGQCGAEYSGSTIQRVVVGWNNRQWRHGDNDTVEIEADDEE